MSINHNPYCAGQDTTQVAEKVMRRVEIAKVSNLQHLLPTPERD